MDPEILAKCRHIAAQWRAFEEEHRLTRVNSVTAAWIKERIDSEVKDIYIHALEQLGDYPLPEDVHPVRPPLVRQNAHIKE